MRSLLLLRWILSLVVIVAGAVLAGCGSYVLASPDGSRLYWSKVDLGSVPNSSWIYAGPWGAAATQTLSLPGVQLGSGALSADGSTLYYTTDTTLHRVNASSLVETGTRTLSTTPGTAIAGQNGYLYLIAGGSVSRIDVPAMTTETTKASSAVPVVAVRLPVITPDGRYLLYSGQDASSHPILNRVDTASLSGSGPLLERALPPVGIAGAINAIALSPDGGSALVASDYAIQKVDVASMQVVAAYATSESASLLWGAAMSPDGSRAYFVQLGSPETLITLDTATMLPITTIPMDITGQGEWLNLNSAGTSLVVGGGNGPLQTISVATEHSVTATISGAGSVSSSPRGIDNCTTTCTRAYLDYQSVTLTATAAKGSTFAGWTGACSGTGTCTLAMSEARAVTATFSRPSNAFTTKTPKFSTTNSTITISTTLTVPGEGRLKQSVSGVARKKATLCSTTKAAKRAGTYTLTCLLGAKSRTALSAGALRLTVATTFAPTGGTARSTSRTVVVPRTPLKTAKPAVPVTG